MNDFTKCLITGDRGEAMATSFLWARPDTEWCKQIPEKNWQEQRDGIDLYWKAKNYSRLLTVQVKYEKRWTGNLFIETDSNYPTKNGWFYTCKADYILYIIE